MRSSIITQEEREMKDKVYYQKKFFNKDLGKEITYSYNYTKGRRGLFTRPLIYGMSDEDSEIRFFLLTILVGVIFFILIMVPVSIVITLIKYYLEIEDPNYLFDLFSYSVGFIFLFISYAVLMPRLIDIKIFRRIMDLILLGRLKKKSG